MILEGVEGDLDVVVVDQVGELVAIDEAYALGPGGDGPGGLAGGVGEVGGRYEDSPGGSVWVEAAGEVPDLGFSHGSGPALGLDVDGVELEVVLVPVDDAVYASVSGASQALAVSVAHIFEEVEDGALEVVGGHVGEGVEDVGLVRSEWRGVRSESLFLGGLGSFDRLSTNGGVGFSSVG